MTQASTFFTSLSFFFAVTIGIVVLIRNPRAPQNRIFALVSLSMAVWSLGLVFFTEAPTRDTAVFWFRVFSSSWPLLMTFWLHFTIELTRDPLTPRKPWRIGLLYVLMGVQWYAIAIKLVLVHDFVRTDFGWIFVSPVMAPWPMANNVCMSIYTFVGLTLMARWGRRAEHPAARRLARFLFKISIFGYVLFVALISVPAVLGVTPIPSLTTIAAFVWLAGIAYGMLKYRLMVMTPSEVVPQILSTMADALLLVDSDKRIVSSNASARRLLAPESESIAGRSLSDFMADTNFLDQAGAQKSSTHDFETQCRSQEGLEVIVSVAASPVVDRFGHPAGMVLVLRDITERKLAEERLRFFATHDLLTRLPNRTILQDNLKQAVARVKRYGHLAAVLLIDLDRFKEVNDAMGHHVGDELLRRAAARLREAVRACDTVARFGGDEFVVVLTDLDAEEGAFQVASRIVTRLTQPFLIDDKEIFTSASIGISLSPLHGDVPEKLLKYADDALYMVKGAGRNGYRLYSSADTEATEKRGRLEKDLRNASAHGELLLYYQPIYDLRSLEVVSVEALLRWQHPELGLLSPMDFMPVAEETGLIVPIGRWVIRTACQQAQIWHAQHQARFQIAVNVSSRQFLDQSLAQTIADILDETGFEARFLELEITETTATVDVNRSIETINRLRELGVRVVIDDFGSGYSSLALLKSLSVHALKIDRLFIKNIDSDEHDIAIVRALVSMAHSLDIQVVVSGVERAAQLDCLRTLKWESLPTLVCDRVQGFLFSRPAPGGQLTELLRGADHPVWHPKMTTGIPGQEPRS